MPALGKGKCKRHNKVNQEKNAPLIRGIFKAIKMWYVILKFRALTPIGAGVAALNGIPFPKIRRICG